jgi:hypothetical protein
VDRSCRSDGRVTEQCALLTYTDQTCVVCVDQTGQPSDYRCERNNCPNGDCPPPAECFFENDVDGALCRTCPVEGSDVLETKCVEETNLRCTQEDVADGDDPSTGAGGTCLSCVDVTSNLEVYRRCNDDESVPACFSGGADEDDVSCEVCVDPVTSEAFYASCSDGLSCYSEGSFELFALDGSSLVIDGAVAVVSCADCGSAEGNALFATCALRNDCGSIDLTHADAICDDAVVFHLEPRLCGNPWEEAGYEGQGVGGSFEITQVLAFALDVGGVGAVRVTDHVSAGAVTNPGDPKCADGCACARGDVVDVAVRPEDAAETRALFGDVIVPCATTEDCGGGACRADGACGP